MTDPLWEDTHFMGVTILILAMVLVIFIYMEIEFNTMEVEKDCNTWNPNAAQTRSICLPKVYTTFGWMG